MTPQQVAAQIAKAGRTITITTADGSETIAAVARVDGGAPDADIGDRHQEQLKITVAALPLAGWAGLPIDAEHIVIIGTKSYRVTGCELLYIRESPARYNLTAQGPV